MNTTWGARIRSGRDLADAFERIFSLARTASQEASATGADGALGLSPELPSEVSLGVYSVEEYLTVLHTHAAFHRGLEREPVPGPVDGQVGRFQGVWVATDSLGWPVEVDCD
ncbi:hypothetical protein, partial [Tessaracoccus sp. OH4464_COT-324]|uniref:hypothetical protein n=1 Tax=Tessaracoccus sp. OH4464_COT-324 TaxID=2491059 RepID=UPI000F9440DB